MPLTRRDSLIAVVVAGCALALYVATVQPGLGGPEDTPKFQFLGHVLGTAHPPGYPLYVLLTHAFVQLPIGTIAYRANLFSAAMAALACAAAFVIGRQIGAGRWAAACGALTLATGVGVWRSAGFAEVYSLAAAIAAFTVALLLAWGARHGAARLLGAVGTFALGLGNHLTIVGLLPAGAWYILIRHRKALSLRLIVACIAVLLLGVSQYWFIVVRSRQATTYLESRATSIAELARVMTAQRFANERFAFGPRALLTMQLPAVASMVRREMGTAGVLLLAAGFAAAIRRRNTAAILVISAAAGLVGMVINIAGDMEGFLAPVFVLLWPVGALGIQTIFDLLPQRAAARYAVLAGTALLPAAGVLANYEVSDHSRATEDARFFRAIFQQLPDTAEIVMEDYWSSMMINYLSFTEETGRKGGLWQLDQRAPTVRKAKRDGRRVFAFAGAATFLEAEGLQFERTALEGPPLHEWLKDLPRSSRIVGAVANTPVPIESLPIDSTHAPAIGAFHPFGAFAWIAGKPNATVDVNDVKASLAEGNLTASADGHRARVEFEGHIVAEIEDGIALAVVAPDGQLLRTLEFHSGEPLRVGFPGALYELKGDSPCADVTADRWTDITSIAAFGSWVAAPDVYGAVTLETELSGSPDFRTRPAMLMGSGGTRTLDQTRNADGTTTVLTELRRRNFQRTLFRISLDHLPTVARARLKPGPVTSLRVCADEPARLFVGDKRQAALRADFESEPYFGPGWTSQERTGAGTVRRSTGPVSTLLLPLDARDDYEIGLNIEADRLTRLHFDANGKNIGECVVEDARHCEIAVPRAVVRTGINWIALTPVAAPEDKTPKAFTFRGARLQRLTLP